MKCINAEEIAYIIQESGGAAVAVHARTRQQYYSGQADWDIIRQVKKQYRFQLLVMAILKAAKMLLI